MKEKKVVNKGVEWKFHEDVRPVANRKGQWNASCRFHSLCKANNVILILQLSCLVPGLATSRRSFPRSRFYIHKHSG